MAALAQDRNAPRRFRGRQVPLKVKAGVKIYKGGMVAVEDASGWAVPASDTAALKVVGIADEQVDNTLGANGDKTVVALKGVFRVKNGTTAIAQAHVGDNVHVEDDQTVRSAGSVNAIVAGVVDSFDADGVWINFA